MATFNVSEFNSIYTLIDEKSDKISMKSNEIIGTCEQLSQLLKSEDSGLAGTYMRIGEALGTTKSKIVNLLTQLENEMKSYAKATLANEQETSAEISKLNTQLDEITEKLRAISSRKI